RDMLSTDLEILKRIFVKSYNLIILGNLNMNPADLGNCQYDPIYGYTQTPRLTATAGDFAPLRAPSVHGFANQGPPGASEYAGLPNPYDPSLYSRYPTFYPTYTSTGPPAFYPDLTSFVPKPQEYTVTGPIEVAQEMKEVEGNSAGSRNPSVKQESPGGG